MSLKMEPCQLRVLKNLIKFKISLKKCIRCWCIRLWRVKRKDLNELCDNSIKSIRNNYKNAKIALKTKFAEAVASAQSSRLLCILSDDESFLEDNIDENLKTMKCIYDSSYNFEKIVAFPLVSQQFSKPTLMDHFQC